MKRLVLILLVGLLGCNPASSVQSVTVTPASATVQSGSSIRLQAVVAGSGTVDPAVTWTASAGMVSATSEFTAPSVTVSTLVTVRAVSVQDASQSGTAIITVNPAPSVSSVTVSAFTPSLRSGQSTTVDANVIGTGNPSQVVTWSIDSGGGTLTPNGGNTNYVFFAPSVTSVSSVILRATSVLDPSQFGTVTLTVTPLPSVTSVTVSAASTNAASGAFVNLSVVIAGTFDPSPLAKWSITSGGGILTSSGFQQNNSFTAPTVTTVTTVTIQAVSQDDPSKLGTVSLTVQPPPANSSVTGITLSAQATTLLGGEDTLASATVTGLNQPSPGVDWIIVSGGGSFSNRFGKNARYRADFVTSPTTVVLRATSAQDSSFTQTITLTVNPAP